MKRMGGHGTPISLHTDRTYHRVRVLSFPAVQRTTGSSNCPIPSSTTIFAIRSFDSSDSPSRLGTNTTASGSETCIAHVVIPQMADLQRIIKEACAERCVPEAPVCA